MKSLITQRSMHFVNITLQCDFPSNKKQKLQQILSLILTIVSSNELCRRNVVINVFELCLVVGVNVAMSTENVDGC